MASFTIPLSSSTINTVQIPVRFPAMAVTNPTPISPAEITLTDSESDAEQIDSLLAAMMASSPTHPTSTPAVSHKAYPSALELFNQITTAAKGKKIVILLDYDGTLSPIVDDPDKAYMSCAMRKAVKKVASCFPTAIVTGRCREKVYGFVKLAELIYAGSHGMDIKGPTKASKHFKGIKSILFQPAIEFFPIIQDVQKAMEIRTSHIPGAKVENNKFCLSVHYRCVDEKLWPEVATEVRSVLKDYPQLCLTQGRKVFEVRPVMKWDKGKALEFVLESLGFSDSSDVFPIYIGDDRTDEDAFKVLKKRGQGLGILVSKIPKETSASYYLQEPKQVMDFLRRLVKSKRFSFKKQFRSFRL